MFGLASVEKKGVLWYVDIQGNLNIETQLIAIPAVWKKSSGMSWPIKMLGNLRQSGWWCTEKIDQKRVFKDVGIYSIDMLYPNIL